MIEPQTQHRPLPGRPRVHKDAAARQQAYRDRHCIVTLKLDQQLIELLNEYVKKSGRSMTIQKAIQFILRAELLQMKAAQIP
jgi:hypothetical protein